MAGKHYSSQNRSSSNHEYNREYIFCEYFLKRQVLNLATSKVIFDLFIRTFFNYLSFNKTQVHLMWLYIHIMYIHIIQLLCLPSKELESCSFTSHRSCCLSVSVCVGGGLRVVVSTAALHASVRGSVPGLGGLKEAKLFLPHPRVKVSIVGSLRDREVACSASDRQGSNFESCVWRTVSSQSSHHPQEVLLAQFSLYVHKGGLKPDSFHLFLCVSVQEVTHDTFT